MAAVEIARCPNCTASLPLEPGVAVIACDYCGTRARVRREGGETIAIALPGAGVWIAIAGVAAVAVGGLVAAVLVFGSSASDHPPPPTTETTRTITEQGPRPPMILGAALEIPESAGSFVALGFKVPPGEIRLTAYTSAGEERWRGDVMGDNQVIRGRLFATADTVVFAGYDGALSTFDADSGARTAHEPTADVVEAACAAGGAVYLTVRGGAHRALAAEATGAAPPPGCERLPALWVGRGVPATLVDGEAARAAGFPEAHRVGAMRVFTFEALALGDRGWLVAAVREQGSNLPMLGLVGADGTLRWETLVPDEAPLEATPSAPDLIGVTGDRVVVSYSRGHREHIAAFAIDDGRRLWDSDSGVIGTVSASVGADAVYYEGPERRLRVLDPATGSIRLELP